MEKIYFYNSKKQKLCGIISGPKSKTAVILCHGLSKSKDSKQYIEIANRINTLGIATLRMDLLGHGESDGNYDDLTLSEAMDDISSASSLLKERGFSKIGFIGSSFGAVGGIMIAPKARFRFLVLISPPTYYNMTEILTSGVYLLRELHKFKKHKRDNKKARLKLKFFRDYGSHDSYAAAEKIRAPVLIIQGNEDKIVPLDKSLDLHMHIKGSVIKIFKGADHEYTSPLAHKKLIDEAVKFATKHAA